MLVVQGADVLQSSGLSSGEIQSVNIEDLTEGDSLSLEKSASGFSRDLLSEVDNLANLSQKANAPMSISKLAPSDLIARQQAVSQLALEAQVGSKIVGQVQKGIDTLTRIQ